MSNQRDEIKLNRVKDKIEGEYESFKENLLAQDKQTIFDSYMKIFFYSNVANYFKTEDLSIPVIIANEILGNMDGMGWLYDEYLYNEYACVDCNEAISEFLHSLAISSQEDSICYIVCGENTDEVSFDYEDAAWKFMEEHSSEGYNTIVEAKKDLTYLYA